MHYHLRLFGMRTRRDIAFLVSNVDQRKNQGQSDVCNYLNYNITPRWQKMKRVFATAV